MNHLHPPPSPDTELFPDRHRKTEMTDTLEILDYKGGITREKQKRRIDEREFVVRAEGEVVLLFSARFLDEGERRVRG